MSVFRTVGSKLSIVVATNPRNSVFLVVTCLFLVSWRPLLCIVNILGPKKIDGFGVPWERERKVIMGPYLTFRVSTKKWHVTSLVNVGQIRAYLNLKEQQNKTPPCT